MPINIYLRLTEKCNLSCEHCFNKDSHTDNIKYDQLKIFLKGSHGNNIIFHGGEPFLVDTSVLHDIIDSNKDNSFSLTSNFTIPLNEEHLEIIKKLSYINISFDPYIRFSSISNIVNYVHNLKRILPIAQNIYINICLTKYVLKIKPRRIIKFLRKLGIKLCRLEYLVVNPYNKHLIADYSDIDVWLCELYDENFLQNNCIEFTVFNEIFQAIKNSKNLSTHNELCCNSTMTINSDGSISNCPADNSNIIGSIHKKSFYEMETIIKNQKHHAKNECLCCRWYNKCIGMCKVHKRQKNNKCCFPFHLAEKISENVCFLT